MLQLMACGVYVIMDDAVSGVVKVHCTFVHVFCITILSNNILSTHAASIQTEIQNAIKVRDHGRRVIMDDA